MADQKVMDKQKAILESAIAVFSARGFWNTPTSLISKTAGVADGTLFNYFATKDDLINEVYLEIKKELAAHLLAGLPTTLSLKDKMRHIWSQYIKWGIQYPEKFKVLRQIGESYELDEAVKEQANEPFVEFERIARESVAKGEIRDYPVEYLASLLESQAFITIQFMTRSEAREVDFIEIGFDILWNGVSS